MLNVMRIMILVYTVIFLLNTLNSGILNALSIFTEQLIVFLLLGIGVFVYSLGLALAIRKGKNFGVKYTRVLLPSFVFILAADLFFVLFSIIEGGIFRGWLKRKSVPQ